LQKSKEGEFDEPREWEFDGSFGKPQSRSRQCTGKERTIQCKANRRHKVRETRR
jgi:hypothetical protein